MIFEGTYEVKSDCFNTWHMESNLHGWFSGLRVTGHISKSPQHGVSECIKILPLVLIRNIKLRGPQMHNARLYEQLLIV